MAGQPQKGNAAAQREQQAAALQRSQEPPESTVNQMLEQISSAGVTVDAMVSESLECAT